MWKVRAEIHLRRLIKRGFHCTDFNETDAYSMFSIPNFMGFGDVGAHGIPGDSTFSIPNFMGFGDVGAHGIPGDSTFSIPNFMGIGDVGAHGIPGDSTEGRTSFTL
jgi:hypothetical protein